MLQDRTLANATASDLDQRMSSESSTPYRPIQYLGNKLRALPEVLEAGSALIGTQARVADLFTGTTVVAQGFASIGHRVCAADTQKYAMFFAQAMLGIGRSKNESCGYDSVIGLLPQNPQFPRDWAPFVEREEEALIRSDAAALASLTEELPLVWRSQREAEQLHSAMHQRDEASVDLPLMTSIYSGTYFGVRQAVHLDELRTGAELALMAGRISKWQYAAILTAIMSAASSAAHSAGKHFAQPLNSGSRSNQKFLDGRLLQDRRVDVREEFKAACDAIDTHAVLSEAGHTCWHGSAESFVEGDAGSDLYYLDPPYTAQQYSRFYHVLETLSTYEFPELFSGGKLTTGLYPSKRYKSAFSSKRRAPNAFGTIISAAAHNGAAVLISYSQSSAASSGNARMISLDDLLDLCASHFGRGNVEWVQLGHRYRQFNSASASNSMRNDPEILITCKPR